METENHDFSLFEMQRMIAWDVYASSALGMSMHPGTTRDSARPLTIQQVCSIADRMLEERDKRFKAM
jgi:hypothetical protein